VNKKFVPDDFIVPEKLETDRFRLKMLSVYDVEKDYDAVMTSCKQLRNPDDKDSWPREDMTIEEDLQDLKVHQEEFLNRIAFAYTVMSLDESQCLGCVYIDPSERGTFDAEVYLWVRTSELPNGLDEILYKTVKVWVNERWPFKNVAYPGREISHEEWRAMMMN
jgi:hypothetical protein